MNQSNGSSKVNSIKKKYLSLLDSEKDNTVNTEAMLLEYISTGIFSLSRGFPDVIPPYQLWESTYLNTGLHVLGYRNLHSLEFSCVNGGEFNIALAGNAVMYVYYSQLIIQNIYALQCKRFGSRSAGQVGMEVIPYAVLALLIGKKDIAHKIFLLLLKSYENDEVVYREYPIYCFILRLLSDFFEGGAISLSGKTLNETLYHRLYDEWRSPDCELLGELCVMACDYHLSQCAPDRGNKWYEFSNLSWSLWPIEINLLFKLRKLMGLKNPDVNHPLMNTILGQLPAEKEFLTDDLLLNVLERMQSQGFDENEVFERVYFEKF